MTAAKLAELLPCPFCGGEAKGGKTTFSYLYWCTKCGCEQRTEIKWNTRATSRAELPEGVRAFDITELQWDMLYEIRDKIKENYPRAASDIEMWIYHVKADNTQPLPPPPADQGSER